MEHVDFFVGTSTLAKHFEYLKPCLEKFVRNVSPCPRLCAIVDFVALRRRSQFVDPVTEFAEETHCRIDLISCSRTKILIDTI